jgi:hypothetical protein
MASLQPIAAINIRCRQMNFSAMYIIDRKFADQSIFVSNAIIQ